MNINIAQLNKKIVKMKIIVKINKNSSNEHKNSYNKQKKDVFKINSNEFMSLNEKQFIRTKQFVDYFFVHLNYF